MYRLPLILDALRTAMGTRRPLSTVELGRLSPSPRERLMHVRCDVERVPQHAVMFAQQMADIGLLGTFYFHTRTDCYDLASIMKIHAMGHEVGYHYECLDRCRGDFAAAEKLFMRELARFRADGIPVATVCNHGELGVRHVGYTANLDMFTANPGLLTSAGLEGEAFLISRRWDRISLGDTFSGYGRLFPGLEESNASDKPLLYVALHPHRWHYHLGSSLREIVRDVRQGVSNRLWGYRSYRTVIEERSAES